MLDGERPQSGVGNIWPVDCRMQHHSSGDHIVMVSANTSKSDGLFEVGEAAG